MKPGAKPLKSRLWTILSPGLYSLLVGLALGGIYTTATGMNGVAQFSVLIFGVPVILMVRKLVMVAREGNPEGAAQPVLAYVDLSERFTAFFFDYILFSAIDLALRFYCGFYPYPNPPEPWPEAYSFMVYLPLVYFIGFEASPLQGTPGKRLMGFHVAGRGGARLPWWRVVLRNVFRIVSIIPLCLGYLVVWFTPRRQALHDYLGGAIHVLGAPQSKNPGERFPQDPLPGQTDGLIQPPA